MYIVLYKVTREWRKLHNEELNDVVLAQYFSGYKIEKNEMGGPCSVYGGGEAYTRFWWGNLRDRDHLGDPDVDERVILRWIFRKWDVGVWTGWSWLRIGTDGGHL
jgi:hypothetical protein